MCRNSVLVLKPDFRSTRRQSGIFLHWKRKGKFLEPTVPLDKVCRLRLYNLSHLMRRLPTMEDCQNHILWKKFAILMDKKKKPSRNMSRLFHLGRQNYFQVCLCRSCKIIIGRLAFRVILSAEKPVPPRSLKKESIVMIEQIILLWDLRRRMILNWLSWLNMKRRTKNGPNKLPILFLRKSCNLRSVIMVSAQSKMGIRLDDKIHSKRYSILSCI